MSPSYDPNSLLRNAKDLPANFRDPEHVVGRIHHFASGHGNFADNFTSPYERGLIGKDVTMIQDYDEMESNALLPRTIHAGMPFEGSADALSRHSLFHHIYDYNKHAYKTSDKSLIDLEEASGRLGPLHARAESIRIGQERLPADYLHISPGGAYEEGDSAAAYPNQDRGKANREVSDAYSKVLKNKGESIRSDVQAKRGPFSTISPGDINSLLKERTPASAIEHVRRNLPSLGDPRFIHVSFLSPYGDHLVDAIDLNSGSWAKLHPDQFFPDINF